MRFEQIKLLANRRYIVLILLILLLAIGVVCTLKFNQPVIYLGLLQQKSELSAEQMRARKDILSFAIQDMNAKNGIDGAQVVLLERQCEQLTECLHATKALKQQGVQAIFGCTTETCKKPIAQLLNEDIPLFYPGTALTGRSMVIQTGAAYNQQLAPMITWAIKHFGKRVYLIEDEYSVTNRLHTLAEKMIAAHDATLLGRHVFNNNVQQLASEILLHKPDVIINLAAERNLADLLLGLRQYGVDLSTQSIFSLNLSEHTIAQLGPDVTRGLYSSNIYFQSLPLVSNQAFIARFQAKFGQNSHISADMMSLYVASQIWAASTLQLKQEKSPLESLLYQQTVSTPFGEVAVDFDHKFLWTKSYLARVNGQGDFEIVWQSELNIRPEPMCNIHTNWCEQ